MIKIFATDMDHTLLDDSSALPSNFQETLNNLVQHDIPLVLASGRSLASMKEKVANIAYDFTFISDNGAIIEKNNQVIHQSSIAMDDFHHIIDIMRKCKETSICATGINTAYIEIHSSGHETFLREYYPSFEIVADMKQVSDEIIKVTSLCIEENDFIYDTIIAPQISNNQNLVALKSGKIWIDVMNYGVDKGKALSHLLNVLELSPEHLATFGDYHNDIGMLKLANYSHAVANAHEDVKKIAKHIIDSNNDGAVMKIINNYLLSKEN